METTMPVGAESSMDGTSPLRAKAAAAKSAVADLAGEAKRAAVDRIGDVKDSSMEWISEKKRVMTDKATEYKDRTDKYVHQKPYTAIAVAAGVGFLLGLILKRR